MQLRSVRVCPAQDMVQCSVHSSLVSCPFRVRGAAGSHGGGRHSPSSPKDVIPAAARTVPFLVRPVRSEKVPSASTLSFSIPWVCVVRACHSLPAEPSRAANPLNSHPLVTRRVLNIPVTWDTLEPTTVRLSSSPFKRQTKTVTATNVHPPRPLVPRYVGETVGDHQVDACKKLKPVLVSVPCASSRVGALAPPFETQHELTCGTN